jgi:hypothetical protein
MYIINQSHQKANRNCNSLLQNKPNFDAMSAKMSKKTKQTKKQPKILSNSKNFSKIKTKIIK